MKKQLKFLLFAILMLTLVMMTMICVSAAADGDTQASVEEAGGTFNEADYNFKVSETKEGTNATYYLDIVAAWAAVKNNGYIFMLKDVSYAAATNVNVYSAGNVNFDGGNFQMTNATLYIYNATASTTANNVISISNLSMQAGSPIILKGAGATYNFTAVTLTTTGWGINNQASGTTLNMLGDKNVINNTNETFHSKYPMTINIEGGTYTNTGDKLLIKFECPNTISNNFDIVCNIYGGVFTRKGTGTGQYNNSLIGFYKNTGKVQLNISGGTFNSYTSSTIKFFNDTLGDVNITGGTFNNYHSSAAGTIWFSNSPAMSSAYKATIGDVENVQTTIDISGATFYQKYDAMPIINLRQTAGCFTDSNPLVINMSDITITDGAAGRLICCINGDSYKVTLKNIVGDFTSGNCFVQAQKATNLDLTMIDCDITAKYLFVFDGTGKVNIDIEGGNYKTTTALLNHTSTATVSLDVMSGNFNLANSTVYSSTKGTGVTVAIKNADAESNALDVNFRLSTVTAETDFTQMTALYNAATNKANVTVTAGYTHTVTADLAGIDGSAALKTAANLTNVPDYVKLDISLIVQEGATVTFTGGTYTTENSYFVRVDNGKVVATGITLNSLYRAFYITQADASVEVELNNCVITVADGHVLQGNTGSNTIAKLYFTINGGTYVAKGSKNVFSFGATTDAKVTITAGDFDLTTNIGYVASAGIYTITGGTFKTGSACFNVAAAATFKLSGATFNSGSSLFSFAADAAACTVTVDDCVVNAKSHVIYSASDAAHDITVKNSVLIQTVEEAMAIINASGATLELTDSIVLASFNTTILNDTISMGAYAPTVKFGGVVYYAYMTTEGAEINKAGAEIYMGLDEQGNLVDGIRFTSVLSADVIALAKAALDAKKSVSYGMIIAPADYVIAAGAFTKEALDTRFGSTAGVLASGKNTYVDVPAVNSKRDANEDGVFESFSAMLINVQEVNYNRAFAAIAYVVVDGEIYYSTFNTLDQARSAKYMAEELIATEFYADDETIMALLNKYAGVVAE